MKLVIILLVLAGCDIPEHYYLYDGNGQLVDGAFRTDTTCSIAKADILMKFELSKQSTPHLECRSNRLKQEATR